MIAAEMAGIRIFATGGIGGVHRGGENSMDISADLTELRRTPVAVFARAPRRSSICRARWKCWRLSECRVVVTPRKSSSVLF